MVVKAAAEAAVVVVLPTAKDNDDRDLTFLMMTYTVVVFLCVCDAEVCAGGIFWLTIIISGANIL